MKGKRLGVVSVLLLLVGIGWYLLRPELLFVSKTVHEEFPAGAPIEPKAPTGKAAATLLTGNFHGVAHETRGVATIYQLPDGGRTLRLTEFETSNGPDVRVYLVAAADAGDHETVKRAGFIDLGAMKGNRGEQNYDVPDHADLEKYRSVTIWCRRFSVNFATAPLQGRSGLPG